LRCLDAIGRVFFVGCTNPEVAFTVEVVGGCRPLIESFPALLEHPDGLVLRKVVMLSSELAKRVDVTKAEAG
jgi:hypothetical protein